MFTQAKKIAWLIIPLCVAGAVWAQEKVETPSQKSKEAVDKFKAAPGSIGKTLQDLGKTVGAKLGLGQGEVTTAKAGPEPDQVSIEEKNEAARPPVVAVIGKRDPFRPFTLNNRAVQQPRKNLSPLERYDLGQLKLVGVIWDAKSPNAMVEDSAGLGYVVKVGTSIGSNEGKVKSIKPEGLVVEEYQIDIYGAKKKIERNMRLKPENAE